MAHSDMIVIGASAGGITALKKLVSCLPQELQASMFVVLHLGTYSSSTVDTILMEAGHVPATFAKNGESIAYGRMYIAPPDFHLLIDKDVTVLSKGPRENLWRPSIDTLFRSAAVSYGVRVVGIILTGYLDDGVAGLLAIQRCGESPWFRIPPKPCIRICRIMCWITCTSIIVFRWKTSPGNCFNRSRSV